MLAVILGREEDEVIWDRHIEKKADYYFNNLWIRKEIKSVFNNKSSIFDSTGIGALTA